MEDEPLPPGVQSLPKYSSNPVRPDHHFNSSVSYHRSFVVPANSTSATSTSEGMTQLKDTSHEAKYVDAKTNITHGALIESTRNSTLGVQNASEIETAAQNVVLHEQVLVLFFLIIFIGFSFCSSCHYLN